MPNNILSLEHEILSRLYGAGVKHISSFNSTTGKHPIYKSQIPTCKLPFANLIFRLNDPKKYDKLPREEFSDPELVLNDIEDKSHITDFSTPVSKFHPEVISITIEILQANGHVEDEITEGKDQHRIIKLTHKGAVALFDKTYLKEKQRESYAEQLHKGRSDNTSYDNYLD